MADKETGLNIPVSASPDKGSGKKAVADLTKEIVSSLKDGYIEIPAEIKVPIKGASKDLEKAQKDVISQWKKTFKEGFSSSADDLDTLEKAYLKFKKLGQSEHKTGSKQYRGINQLMGSQMQEYKKTKQSRATDPAEIELTIAKEAKKRADRKRVKDTEAEAIQDAINKENKRQLTKAAKREAAMDKFTGKLSTGASRAKAATPGAEVNLGERSSTWGGSQVTERSIKLSDTSGPYSSNLARQQAQSEKEAQAKMKASLTSRKADEKEIEEISDRLNKKKRTEYNWQLLMADLILKKVAQVQGSLIAGGGATPADLQKSIADVLINAFQTGSSIDKAVVGIGNMLMNRYSSKGVIGATGGGVRGEGRNQVEADKTLKTIFADLKTIIGDGFNERRKNDTLIATALQEVKPGALIDSISTAVGPLMGQTTSPQLIQDRREYIQERVNDAKQNKAARTEIDVSESTRDTVRRTEKAGFNNNKNATTMIHKGQTHNKLLGNNYDVLTRIKEILEQIDQKMDVISDGAGTGDGGRRRRKTGKISDDITKALVPFQEMIGGKLVTSKVSEDQYSEEEKARLRAERQAEIDRAKAAARPDIPEEDKFKVDARNKTYLLQQEERLQKEKEENEKKQHEQVVKNNNIALQLLQESIKNRFKGMTSEAARIGRMTEQKMQGEMAERIAKYGLTNQREMSDTGAKAQANYTKSLFGLLYGGKDNKNLMQDIQITEGIEVDEEKIMGALNKVLSGPEMFKAQTGGLMRNIIGSMTGYIGMPSLEKSRAGAEGLNQVLSNVRNEIERTLNAVKGKESELAGMAKRGEAAFDDKGKFIETLSTPEAKKTAADLEEQKMTLRSVLAEMANVDAVIASTGGKVNRIIKNLGFVSPALKENNVILSHLNAGLDKSGKALKFQSRFAEILNYSFQLMARSVGQMFKNWMVQLNPLTQIKKLFTDFSSYDVKWQRTMNVIKYNLRDIVKPFMEWIAQKLVNIIGFFDIISMKIQAAFGNKPISLFDQENAKKTQEEIEKMYNVSAGFDELHDIGADAGTGAMDLLGDIYKPTLSPEWAKIAGEIGDLFAGVIKGDIGFGEAMKRILKIAWDTVAALWTTIIWPFLKDTVWPFVTKHFGDLLGTLLKIFLAWQLLKLAGNLLWNALFGKITAGAVGGLLGKVGGWIVSGLKWVGTGLWNLLGMSTLGQQMQVGFMQTFTGQGLIGALKGGGATLGSVFAGAMVAVIGSVLGGMVLADAFGDAADDASYNIGLKDYGGDDKDKKKQGGNIAKGAAGGAIAGASIGVFLGGPVGAAIGGAIGAVAGAITTALAPAIEAAEVAARKANNEMMKIEYYQGAVQGATTEVNKLDEVLKLSNTGLEEQTKKVYTLGEEYGINTSRLDSLIGSVKDGTYNTDLLSGSELNLADSLEQLAWQYTNSETLTGKLTEAKKKLEKASMDLAIAEDIEAGNFEIAAARIEVAYASNVYTAEEATAKMVQIAKEGSAEQATAMLKDLSPDLQKKFQKEYSTVDGNIDELTKLYYNYSKKEREYFLQNLTGDVQKEMQSRVSAIESAVKNAPWYMRLLDIGNDGKIFGKTYVDVPGYATGTNYVPNDGLAYLHKGEAVIPAEYNEGMGQQGAAYKQQQVANGQMMGAISKLQTMMQQGINVSGEFTQRGSDLVAVVNKTNSQKGSNLLNNVAYAR